jgi:hypothetical protein
VPLKLLFAKKHEMAMHKKIETICAAENKRPKTKLDSRARLMCGFATVVRT